MFVQGECKKLPKPTRKKKSRQHRKNLNCEFCIKHVRQVVCVVHSIRERNETNLEIAISTRAPLYQTVGAVVCIIVRHEGNVLPSPAAGSRDFQVEWPRNVCGGSCGGDGTHMVPFVAAESQPEVSWRFSGSDLGGAHAFPFSLNWVPPMSLGVVRAWFM